MKKYIEISEEALSRLVEGKYVDGSLHRDAWTGRISFRMFNRKPRVRHKDRLVKKLPWGWIRESMERIKVFGSYPKNMGTAKIMGL